MFDADRLHALALEDNRPLSASLAEPLELHIPVSTINTALRHAHFIAQVCYESQFFQRLSENLFYSTPERIAAVWPFLADRAASLVRNPLALGNAAYADRNGNGDEASGDGYRFRGRGLIELTGRTNYVHFGTLSGLDIIDNPDSAGAPDNAVRLAIAFWDGANCNEAADLDDVAGVTRKINGPGLEGLADRKVLTTRAKTIFI